MPIETLGSAGPVMTRLRWKAMKYYMSYLRSNHSSLLANVIEHPNGAVGKVTVLASS